MSTLSSQYWKGEAINFKENILLVPAGFLSYKNAFPEWDKRVGFSSKHFTDIDSNWQGERTTITHVKGAFNISPQGEFEGGMMDEYTSAIISPNMAYQDIQIGIIRTGSTAIAQENFWLKTNSNEYNDGETEIWYHQQTLDDGRRSYTRREGRRENGTSELISYETFEENDAKEIIHTRMSADGIDPRFNFDLLTIQSSKDLSLIWKSFEMIANNNKDNPYSTDPETEQSPSTSQSIIIKIPTKFKKKYTDKITNFNPSTDTLEIDTESFGIDSSANFASGKNKKTVKKQLAKQDVDFLYDEKKGGLYFNENGSDKGFGEGGIIAILKGAPEMTSGNLEFI